MARSGEIYDHMKSGQLRGRGENRIKTEPMMMHVQYVTLELLFKFTCLKSKE